MAVYTLTSSPTTIEDGTHKGIDVTNTGTENVTLSTGDVLKPGAALTICPTGAITATASPLNYQLGGYAEATVAVDTQYDPVIIRENLHDNATFTPLPTAAKNPLTGWMHADGFGAVGDGVTDDTAALQAAIAALGNNPGVVYLPTTKTGGSYLTTAALVLNSSQSLIGEAISGGAGTGNTAFSVSLFAGASFSGDAMVKSYTWNAGGGGTLSWHWGAVENIRIDCNSVAPAGVAIHAMGENSTLRRVMVTHAADSGFLLTGTHAPCTLEHCGAFNSANYGLKLTTHPTYSGNSGAVRLDGFSGDNNVGGHIYCDGSHSIFLSGWKSESHTVGVLLAGSGSPNIFAAGYFNTGQTTPDVFKVSGTCAPRITSVARSNGATNYINDTVTGYTLPGVTVPALVTYGGKVVLAGQVSTQRATYTRTGNGSVTVDASKGSAHEVTLAGNATSATISNPFTGQEIVLTYIQDGTGGRSYVWPTATYAGGAAPSNVTTAGTRDSVRLAYDGAAWNEVGRSQRTAPALVTSAKSGKYLLAPPQGGTFTTGTLAQGSLRYVPFMLDRAATISEIGTEVQTGGSTGALLRFGIYADDGSGFPSSTPLLDAGTVDATLTGFRSVTGLSLALGQGRYWLAYVTQGSPVTGPTLRFTNGYSPGIVAFSGATGGSNASAYVDAAATAGALPSANPNGTVTGHVCAVKIA